MLFEKIIKNYTDYIRMDYEKKLHAGNLLAESARMLLQIDTTKLENKDALQRNFLMRKVAKDLLEQVRDMAYTKQYDCAPILKEYTYLAFDLACNYCESNPNRILLPFLTSVMSYERQNTKIHDLEKLKDLYKKSLALEKTYLAKLCDFV